MAEMIYVKMLGGFSVQYDGKPLAIPGNRKSIVMTCLQYFLYHHAKRFTGEELYRDLYAWQESEDPGNVIRINIFRLKKALAQTALPPRDYIDHVGRCYSWTQDIACRTDVDEFDEAATLAAERDLTPDEELTRLRRAVSLYTGELLPDSQADYWVVSKSVQLKERYLTLFQRLGERLIERGLIDELLSDCDTALRVYPEEERLHAVKIQALFADKRYNEAIEAFSEASNTSLERLGIPPSDELLSLYSKLSAQVMNGKSSIVEIKRSLQEGEHQFGAYECSFSTFAEGFHFIVRVAERLGQSIYLLALELDGGEGDRFRAAANALRGAVSQTLRRGDLFTRYSNTQYLVLLLGANSENCTGIFERVQRNWRKNWTGKGIRLGYSAISACASAEESEPLSFDRSGELWQ